MAADMSACKGVACTTELMCAQLEVERFRFAIVPKRRRFPPPSLLSEAQGSWLSLAASRGCEGAHPRGEVA